MAEPAVTVPAASHDGATNLPPTRVVIHATAGGRGFPKESAAGVAHATAEYFSRPGCPGSAHYVEDVSSEEHCLPDNVVGWHAPPNAHSIGIEICAEANYNPDQWKSDQVWPAVLKAAARARELCQRYGIPMVKLSASDLLAGKHGIAGHVDVSAAWHQSSHWDPGPGFPWPEFIAAVNQSDAPPPPAPPTPAPAPIPRPGAFQWRLPVGHYYGNWRGPAASHGGYYAAERDEVRNIQQWLIYRGCVAGHDPANWMHDGWADGKWDTPTDAAMTVWHQRFYPGQPQPAQCWLDDYVRLTG